MKRSELKLCAALILVAALLAFMPTMAQEANDVVTAADVFATPSAAAPAAPGAPWWAGILATLVSAVCSFALWQVAKLKQSEAKTADATRRDGRVGILVTAEAMEILLTEAKAYAPTALADGRLDAAEVKTFTGRVWGQFKHKYESGEYAEAVHDLMESLKVKTFAALEAHVRNQAAKALIQYAVSFGIRYVEEKAGGKKAGKL